MPEKLGPGLNPKAVASLLLAALLNSLVTGVPQASDVGREPKEAGTRPQEADPRKSSGRETTQEPPGERLETVVVTATRQESPVFDLPYHAARRGPRELDRARLLQETLRDVPGISLQRTSYGQAAPFIRGLTGHHTLLLIDGIRLNNSVWRAGPNEYWGTVDPLSLAGLEVVMGPGSVLYGSDAVSGTVNALSRRRRSYGQSSWDRRLFLRLATAEHSVIGRAEVSGNLGSDFGFVLGSTGASLGDLEAGGSVGRQDHTGYGSRFADARLDAWLDESWSVSLLAQAARIEDAARLHRTIYGVPYRGTEVGTDLRHNLDWERDLLAFFLRGEDLEGMVDSMELRLSFQRLAEELDRVLMLGDREASGWGVDSLGVGLELVSRSPLGDLTYGFDLYHDEVDSFRRFFDAGGTLVGQAVQGPVGDDAGYDLLGVFLQDIIRLTEAWELVLGGRLTYARAKADRVADPTTPGASLQLEDSWTAVVGAARVLWRVDPHLHLHGGISQAFRAPNLSDISRFNIARSGEVEVPSPSLDPERFLSLEVGAKVEGGAVSAEAAYYFTWIDELVIRQPTGATAGGSNVVTKRNAGDGHVQGIEVRGRWDLDGSWAVLGTFSWTDGVVEAYPTSLPVLKREPLTRLTPIQARLGFRWQSGEGDFWIQPWVVMVAAQDRLSSADLRDTQRIPAGGTPGITLYNIEAGMKLDSHSHLFLALENLTDKNFRVHGSGLQEAGFNLVVGCDLTF